MKTLREGDVVKFKYHNQMREGRVERTWPSIRRKSGYRDGGFCVDHGGFYKSYSNSKVVSLAKQFS